MLVNSHGIDEEKEGLVVRKMKVEKSFVLIDDDGGDGSFLVTQFGHFDPATGLFDPLADFGGPVLQVDGNPGGS